MTRLLPLVFLLVSLAAGLVSCEDDDDTAAAEGVIQLDGPNQISPFLEAGVHRFAVRFDEATLGAYAGGNLRAARIFIGVPPDYMRVSVHAGGTTAPGLEQTALEVTGFADQRGFVDYRLPSPVPIVGDEALWIVAEVDLPATQQSIGCDAGPAVPGGDWLWSGDEYLTFPERTGESVNWNIRGVID